MDFIKNLKTKVKLTLLSIFLISGVLIWSGLNLFNQWSKISETKKLEELIILSTKISELVHETQKERGATAGFIGSNGKKFKNMLFQQRELTNSKIKNLENFLEDFDKSDFSHNFQNNLDSAISGLKNIQSIRNRVNNSSISLKEALKYYTISLNGYLLDTISSTIELSKSPELTRELTAYSNFLYAKERAGIERAVLSNTFAKDKFDVGMYSKFIKLVSEQDVFLKLFKISATDNILDFYNNKMSSNYINEVNKMRDIANSKFSTGNFNIDAEYWFATISKKINLLKEVDDFIAKDIAIITNKIIDDNWSNVIFFQVLSMISIFLSVMYTIFVIRDITGSLGRLDNGLVDFFKFLNKESNHIDSIKIDSDDEFGSMAKMVNSNVARIHKHLYEDKVLIDDLSSVAQLVAKGNFHNKITTHTDNPILSDLKSVINNMLVSVDNSVEKVLITLDDYSKYNYKSKVDIVGLEGELKKLADGVNSLGDSITTMLMDNRKSGLNLQEYSNLLANNMSHLSQASNEQAASLEETAAALEEITSNVRNNTDKATKMAQLAQDVQKESNHGDKMAHDTATAMDEINNSTNAINEAITVIDQIAFQTNILSLNAAVEAASAGEAGKGFAVVAGEVRNLASRSAEAAKEIKDLVESAQYKANEGKEIADKMIKGYVELNQKISEQSHLIEDVVNSSKEQMAGIEQINDSVTQLDGMTQNNTQMVNSTNDASKNSAKIAIDIVAFTDNKNFEGKESIKINKSTSISSSSTTSHREHSITKKTSTKSSSNYSKPKQKPQIKSTPTPTIVSNSDSDDDWAEF